MIFILEAGSRFLISPIACRVPRDSFVGKATKKSAFCAMAVFRSNAARVPYLRHSGFVYFHFVAMLLGPFVRQCIYSFGSAMNNQSGCLSAQELDQYFLRGLLVRKHARA